MNEINGRKLKMSRFAVALCALTTMLALAPAAGAANGTYTVVACDAAGGPNRSWTAQPGSGSLFLSRQRCPALGEYDGFGMRSSTFALKAPQLSGSWWRFDAPEGTSLAALDWAGHYSTGAPGWAARIESARTTIAGCGPSPRSCERQWAHGAKPVRYELAGAGWVRVGAVCLGASGCRTGDGRTTPFVDASTWYARVTVRDPAPPRISASGAALERPWVLPGSELVVDANDSSGIESLRLLVDGSEVDSRRFDCDNTRPKPCSDRSVRLRLPVGVADGRRTVTVVALDAAGNRAEREFDIGVDGSAPAPGPEPSVIGGDSWRPSPTFQLEWQVPQVEGGSPIAASVLRVCPLDAPSTGARCLADRRIPAQPGVVTSVSVDVPADGEWTATVAFEDSAGNFDWREASAPAALRCDRSSPGVGRIVAPEGWIGRSAANSLALKVSPDPDLDLPLSGIAGWAVARGGVPGTIVDLIGSTVEIPLSGTPEGVTDVSVRAIGGSGLASRAVATARVRVDESPPVVELSGIPSGQWSAEPVTLVARGRDQANLSGMGTGEGSSAEVRISIDGDPADSRPGDSNSVEVADDGVHVVEAEAVDAAGNSSGKQRATVRVDSTPPERVAFLPQDVSDPRIVRVDAVDSGSGLSSTTIRMRRISGGEWIDLPGRRNGSRYEASIDESKLSQGLWELEATAVDLAGNERTSSRTLEGDPAVIAVPLRMATRIDGSFVGSGSNAAAGDVAMTVAHGRSATVAGVLLDSEERPLANAVVSLVSAPLMVGSEWASGGSAVTDRLGRFDFRLPPGPGRRIRVVFDGDHRALPSSRSFTLRVPAWTSLKASPSTVRVGRVATFSGRLAGGMIPRGGKIVTVQAMIPGRGWQAFAVARSNAWGEWSARYRFRASVGRAGYSIRVVVPSEAGYPFGSWASSPIRVTAIG